MKKTILILGTNSGQLDLIKEMKNMGWYVIACSNRSDEIGVGYADDFYEVDIRNTEVVKEIAQNNTVDIVYSVSSDTAMTSVVKVATELGLPIFYSNEFIKLLDNKEALRNFLNQVNLSYVNYVEVAEGDDIKDWSEFPCIVKPSNAQGQRGVKKVHNDAELQDAVANAKAFSSNKTAIVEDFLDGVELSCNVLVSKGQVVFDVLSERLVYGDEFFGIPKGHLVPCVNVDKTVQDEAVQLVNDVVKALKVENGPLYFQMKATQKGVKIIEIAPRLDGCHMWRLIKHATGRNFLIETLEVLFNQHTNTQRVEQTDGKNYELVFQHASPDQTFKEIDFPLPETSLYHEFRYSDGEEINIINGKKEVVGYYIAECSVDKWVEA